MAKKKNRLQREIYNARKRLENQIEREIRSGASERKVERLKRKAESLKGGVTAGKLEAARKVGGAKSAKRSDDAGTVDRRTAVFKQRLNAKAEQSGYGYTSDERDLFFAATRRIWVGREGLNDDPSTRVERITNYFYRGDTEEAREFQRWARRMQGGSRAVDPSLILDYVLAMNADESQDKLYSWEVDDTDGGSPKGFQRLVWFG